MAPKSVDELPGYCVEIMNGPGTLDEKEATFNELLRQFPGNHEIMGWNEAIANERSASRVSQEGDTPPSQ